MMPEILTTQILDYESEFVFNCIHVEWNDDAEFSSFAGFTKQHPIRRISQSILMIKTYIASMIFSK